MIDEVRVTLGNASVEHFHVEHRLREGETLVELKVAGEGVLAALIYTADRPPIPFDVPIESLEAEVTVTLRPRGSVRVIDTTGG